MIFERVVVGVDGSETGFTACRLAHRLRSPSGCLRAVAVAETPYAVHTGMAAPEWTLLLQSRADAAAQQVLSEFQDDPRVQADVETGYAAQRLLDLVRAYDADLVGVGSREVGRTAGILLGTVATRVIHEAPCSVLVARGDVDVRRFPRSILVGVDGSSPAREAEAVAEMLGERAGARLQRLIATGEHAPPAGVAAGAEVDPRRAVDALVDHSDGVDLLVVGSRGLHGLKSLGSVAERVAHHAHCPVLIVRNVPQAALQLGEGRREAWQT